MKPNGNLIGTILGLGLLAAILAGAYLLLKYAGHVFASLEPQTESLAVIASVVALLCAKIIAGGLKARAAGELQTVGAARRIAIYEQLLLFCSEGVQPLERPRLERMLALHGSAEVISAYFQFRRAATGEATALLQALVVEMRKDARLGDLIRNDDELRDLLLGSAS